MFGLGDFSLGDAAGGLAALTPIGGAAAALSAAAGPAGNAVGGILPGATKVLGGQGVTGSIGDSLDKNKGTSWTAQGAPAYTAAPGVQQAGVTQAQMVNQDPAALQNMTSGAQAASAQNLAAANQLGSQLSGNNAIGNQNDLAGQLRQQALGGGPNPAQMQYMQNVDQNNRQATGMLASTKGLNPALAARMASQGAAQANQQAAGTAGIQQAQQQLASQGMLGQLSGAQINQQQGQQNLAGGLALGQFNSGTGAMGQQNTGNLAANAQQIGQNQFNAGQANNYNLAANKDLNAYNLQNTQQQNQYNSPMANQIAAGQIKNTGSLFNALGGGASQMMGGGGGAATGAGSTTTGPAAGGFGGGMGGAGATDLAPMAAMAAQGGEVHSYSNGGTVTPPAHEPRSRVGRYLKGLGHPAASTSQMPQMAHGGKVPALVSPGEVYLPPEKVKQVAKNKASPLSGEKIPGKAKKSGNSYANDTVPKTLESGGIVLPRSVTTAKDAPKKAAAFVAAILAKKGLKN